VLLFNVFIQSTDLINFENKVAETFNQGKIKAPVHLYSGTEEQVIKVFESIKEEDWVFCSWRSHYQCLLKGVPENILFEAILEGRSIALNFPDYKIFSSAIVGGQISLALGAALSIKLNNSNEQVFCFMGDMTSETGIAQSAFNYALNFELPITFIIEDNNLSVCTDTRQIWGTNELRYEHQNNPKVISYKYKNKYPHAGAGKRVQF
jgi:TPP-dependent pyruvate/acetoin dehydrogenase alpha subunit